MGTQQILLLILSVIIVGVAVSVTIYAFGQQAISANRNAMIADMNYLAAISIAYYKTPANLGGGDGIWVKEDLYSWLSMETTRNGKRLLTENGQINVLARKNGQRLVFIGYGNEIGLDETKAVRARLVLKGPEASPKLVFLN